MLSHRDATRDSAATGKAGAVIGQSEVPAESIGLQERTRPFGADAPVHKNDRLARAL